MDVLTSKARSAVMAKIGGKHTAPEIAVRRLLHRLGFRFRLHSKALPGEPDIVLPRHRTVIFVHGCFWHQHPGCKFAYKPKSRIGFWMKKFESNADRDQRVFSQLRALGWKVGLIWECETADPISLEHRI